ncbi:MAG: glycosyltransferase family 4 protein, partial [Vicinamibacterales bacterium]
MRVAVASWTTRHAGGVESYVEKVIPALRAAGSDVSLFHEADGPADRARIDIGDAPVFSAAASGVDAAMAALRAWKPEVLYLQGLHDPQTFARLTALAPSVSFIHTYFGTCISGSKTHTRPHAVPCAKRFGPMCLVHYFPRGCGGKSPVTMWQLYQKEQQQLATLLRQNAVLTHSAHMQRELAAHGVAADVIPYVVSIPDARADPNTAKSSDILFAGRMDHLKGGMLLLDAVPLIRRRLNRPLRVVFAGDGPDRQHWESRAMTIAEGDSDVKMMFTGWCDEARLAALMRDARLLAVPSVWPEPFGSVGMAAARYGVPAAAFDVGGIPQWLHDGVNGHLAPGSPPTAAGLAEAIVKCLDEPRHYEEISLGARRMASTFTMEQHLPALV